MPNAATVALQVTEEEAASFWSSDVAPTQDMPLDIEDDDDDDGYDDLV